MAQSIESRLLKMAPIKWQAFVAKLPAAQRQEVYRQLDYLAAQCAFLGSYINEIDEGQEHDISVVRSNRIRRKVRAAMGYDNTRDIPI